MSARDGPESVAECATSAAAGFVPCARSRHLALAPESVANRLMMGTEAERRPATGDVPPNSGKDSDELEILGFSSLIHAYSRALFSRQGSRLLGPKSHIFQAHGERSVGKRPGITP